jgi:ribonucleoside-diphosphate reductase alpha chain
VNRENELKLTQNAITVLEKRYLARDEEGNVIETPGGMFRRVAENVASVERLYNKDADVNDLTDQFYKVMTDLDFLPNSPTLMNAGRELQQLSACFVLPVEDSMNSIFDSVKHAALIHKSGGGCIKAGTNVYVENIGLVDIEKIYNDMSAKGLRTEPVQGAYRLDVSGEEFYTVSFNKNTGKFERDRITALWQYGIPEDEQFVVECEGGLKITTSRWHPFLVFDNGKIVEKRADELVEDDQLLITDKSLQKLVCTAKNHSYIQGIAFDEDLAWLLGLIAAKGSIESLAESMTIKFIGVKTKVAKEICSIVLKRLNGVCTFEPCEDGESLVVMARMPSTVYKMVKQDEGLFRFFKSKTEGSLIFPDMVLTSPLSVVSAFLAGVIDTQAVFRKTGMRILSEKGQTEWLDKLLSLLALLGIDAKLAGRSNSPSGIDIPNSRSLSSLLDFCAQYSVSSCVSQPPAAEAAEEKKTAKGKKPNTRRVRKITIGGIGTKFYDFTVEKNNNYISGSFGLTVIHNTGFSFSRLRPKGDVVKTTGGVASGPVSFMKVFNAATEAVKQGGMRRGANMGILRADHPDILDFIECKKQNMDITNFNISVALTEKFMLALMNNEEYDLVNPRTGETKATLSARKVFDMIVEAAWLNGEPGIIFLDRINQFNPTPHLGEIESTNPCGEQPLLAYEACNLGSINLSNMVDEENRIDWNKLESTTKLAVHFLDNVIDVSLFPIDKITEMVKRNRKIGLGVMGFADMLIKLGISYDSEEAVNTAEEVMGFINAKSKEASVELAETRGVFPAFEGSIYDVEGGPRLRNATTTTVAPTGTLSIIAGCSSGIEPLFAVCYVRNVMDNARLLEINPLFEKFAREKDFYSDNLMQRIADEGTLSHIDEIPEEYRRLFATAHDVAPEWHIRIQAAFQKYTDNAVSKTVNFRNEATREDVEKVYMLAYELGCKGVTVYRDGSRESQVLTLGSGAKGKSATTVSTSIQAPNFVQYDRVEPRPRPQVLSGRTYKIHCGCGNIYVTINEDEYGVFEAFTSIGKSGGCAASQLEAVSRLASMLFRVGADEDAIKKQLRGIRCPNPAWDKGGIVSSCADALGIALEMHLEWKRTGNLDNFVSKKVEGFEAVLGACPECGGHMIYESGCGRCLECGYSKCG